MLPGVRGYLLAGGESSRMQRAGLPRDKAMLPWRGTTLLQHGLATLRQVCETCRVLGGTAERGARLGLGDTGLLDNTPGLGPLGGLEAALTDAADAGIAWVLLLPVDLPHLPADLLLHFGRATLAAGSAAACMQSGGEPEPLPMLVRSAAAALVRHRLQGRERKLLPALRAIADELTPHQPFHPLPVEQWHHGSDGALWFRNVNTPEDFDELRRHETLGTGLHHTTHGGT